MIILKYKLKCIWCLLEMNVCENCIINVIVCILVKVVYCIMCLLYFNYFLLLNNWMGYIDCIYSNY